MANAKVPARPADALVAGMNREELTDLFTRAVLLCHGQEYVALAYSTVQHLDLDELRKRTREAELAARTPFRFMAFFICDDCAKVSSRVREPHCVIVHETFRNGVPPPSDSKMIAEYASTCCASRSVHRNPHLMTDQPMTTIHVRCDACVDPRSKCRGHTMTMSSNGLLGAKPDGDLAKAMYDKFVQQHSSLHPSHSTMLHLLSEQ